MFSKSSTGIVSMLHHITILSLKSRDGKRQQKNRSGYIRSYYSLLRTLIMVLKEDKDGLGKSE